MQRKCLIEQPLLQVQMQQLYFRSNQCFITNKIYTYTHEQQRSVRVGSTGSYSPHAARQRQRGKYDIRKSKSVTCRPSHCRVSISGTTIYEVRIWQVTHRVQYDSRKHYDQRILALPTVMTECMMHALLLELARACERSTSAAYPHSTPLHTGHSRMHSRSMPYFEPIPKHVENLLDKQIHECFIQILYFKHYPNNKNGHVVFLINWFINTRSYDYLIILVVPTYSNLPGLVCPL